MIENDDEIIKFDIAKHVLINEFYFNAKVKDEVVEQWIVDNKLKIIQTTAGKAVTFESIHKLANTQEWVNERNNALVEITKEEIRLYGIENDKFLMNIKYYIH